MGSLFQMHRTASITGTDLPVQTPGAPKKITTMKMLTIFLIFVLNLSSKNL